MNNLDASSLSSVELIELQLRYDEVEWLHAEYGEVQLLLECSADSIKIRRQEISEFEYLHIL